MGHTILNSSEEMMLFRVSGAAGAARVGSPDVYFFLGFLFLKKKKYIYKHMNKSIKKMRRTGEGTTCLVAVYA